MHRQLYVDEMAGAVIPVRTRSYVRATLRWRFSATNSRLVSDLEDELRRLRDELEESVSKNQTRTADDEVMMG